MQYIPDAEKIVQEMERNQGLISAEDLENYKAVERSPVEGTYKNFKIVSMPPASSGGIHLIQMLNMLEEFPIKEMGFGSADSIHILAEVMKRAYADRSKHLGDMDFYDVPFSLMSKGYSSSLNKSISIKSRTASKDVFAGDPYPYESPDTTHFSVMDQYGNVVSNSRCKPCTTARKHRQQMVPGTQYPSSKYRADRNRLFDLQP